MIAHELGHAIMGYLYEKETHPYSIDLRMDQTSMGRANFEEWSDLPCADDNLSRLHGISYLGGMFGELLWVGYTEVRGLRSDMDEWLTQLSYLGEEGRHRRSRSKLYKELCYWYYGGTDDWSFAGMMRRWLDSSYSQTGQRLYEGRVKKRLPETWKIYQRFLAHIDPVEFKAVVEEIYQRGYKVVPRKTLEKFGRRIIPDTVLHPEDI